MGTIGRQAIEERLGWPSQAPRYVGVYDRLLDRENRWPTSTTGPVGREVV